MAWSILFIAVLIFAFRGFFLATPGVIGRCIGLVLGYLTAFLYHQSVANWLDSIIDSPLPPVAFKVIAGSGLFFLVVISINILVRLVCQGLSKALPFLSPILDKNALTSRLVGAVGNSCIAIALVLIGLWAYGQFSNPKNPDELQLAANQFGDALFANVNAGDFFNSSYFSSTKTTISGNTRTTTTTSRKSTGTGTAVIQTATETIRLEAPHQQPSVDSIQQNIDIQQLGQLMQNQEVQEQLKTVLQNDQMMQMAEDYIKNNPQALKDAMNNPQIRQLLQQFQQRQQQAQ